MVIAPLAGRVHRFRRRVLGLCATRRCVSRASLTRVSTHRRRFALAWRVAATLAALTCLWVPAQAAADGYWRQFPGVANDIAVGRGYAWVIGTENEIYRWQWIGDFAGCSPCYGWAQ